MKMKKQRNKIIKTMMSMEMKLLKKAQIYPKIKRFNMNSKVIVTRR